jgi:hypothetical protein
MNSQQEAAPGNQGLPDNIKNLLKYGEFCQLTYDSVDLNPWSRYRYQNM